MNIISKFMRHISGFAALCCVFTSISLSTVYSTTVGNAAEGIVYGDVSGDNKVDSADYTLVRKYLIGLQTTLPGQNWQQAGDVNLDGKIDSADFTNIRRYLLNMISVLPIGVPTITPIPSTGIYQAEEATKYNGVVETTNIGYTGSGYVNYDNVIGSYVEWNVNVPSAGSKALLFKYANGSTIDRAMEIKVNGKVVTSSTSFNGTASWTDWKTNSIITSLNTGLNIIRATATTVNGGPNVDYLEVTTSTITPTSTIIPTNTPTTKPSSTPTPLPTSATKPVVYIAGDSTVQTYRESYYPQQGWGKLIPNYFTTDVSFVNKAIGGRSSKSFVVDGRLDEILNVIKAGDYLFVQFGHNDASSVPERHTDANTTYKQYLKMYIDGARKKNAIPVLITPVGRYSLSNGVFKNDFPTYCAAMKAVATENDCKIIDLMTKSLSLYNSLGTTEAKKLFLASSNGTDYTHFTETGASQIAKLVAGGVKEINVPISKYVK